MPHILFLLHFFYAEKERKRKKEGMGWIDYSYYFNFSNIYIINMNKRIITNKNALTELY